MATATQTAVEAEWISKEAAAKRLQLAVRTILDMAAKGKLGSSEQLDPAVNRMAVFLSKVDVERMAAERLAPAKAREITPRVVEPQVKALEPQVKSPAAAKPWMTLDQAAEECGLSRTLLLRMVLDGELPARREYVKEDRWRVHRLDVDALRGVAVTKPTGV